LTTSREEREEEEKRERGEDNTFTTNKRENKYIN
jgi:hypothetical protein